MLELDAYEKYLKIISIKQRMLIFSSSFLSFCTNASWALKAVL
jgi:hypothetical protein